MKLLMLTALAGTNFSVAKGDVVQHYDDAEAERWITAEFAEKADAKAKVTVVLTAPEAEPPAPEVEIIEAIEPEPVVEPETVETVVASTEPEAG